MKIAVHTHQIDQSSVAINTYDKLWHNQIDGLVQERRNSSALALLYVAIVAL